MCVLFYVCVGTDFVDWLEKGFIYILYVRRVFKWAFAYDRVCPSWSWQDVKIQFLTNLVKVQTQLLLQPGVCLFVWCPTLFLTWISASAFSTSCCFADKGLSRSFFCFQCSPPTTPTPNPKTQTQTHFYGTSSSSFSFEKIWLLLWSSKLQWRFTISFKLLNVCWSIFLIYNFFFFFLFFLPPFLSVPMNSLHPNYGVVLITGPSARAKGNYPGLFLSLVIRALLSTPYFSTNGQNSTQLGQW